MIIYDQLIINVKSLNMMYQVQKNPVNLNNNNGEQSICIRTKFFIGMFLVSCNYHPSLYLV